MSTAQASGLLRMHPKAFLRLKSRYRREGEDALWPRKPGPKPGSREPANKTPEEVEDLVLALADRFPWLGPDPLAEKVAGRLGGSWCWEGDEAVCEVRGAKARVGYDDEEISIDVSLPLMLRPLRGKLETKIEEYFERYFGQ